VLIINSQTKKLLKAKKSPWAKLESPKRRSTEQSLSSQERLGEVTEAETIFSLSILGFYFFNIDFEKTIVANCKFVQNVSNVYLKLRLSIRYIIKYISWCIF